VVKQYDLIIIGAGAAGLMCALTAGKQGKSVLVLEKEKKPGKKILMAGGGRCNFTNYHIDPEAFLSHNPHFCKSALSTYTQWDFIKMVEEHSIPYHEKKLGQLFCDNKSKDILKMLLSECEKANATIELAVCVNKIEKKQEEFSLSTTLGNFTSSSLVIATGGLSIPTTGASPFAYQIAEQFGLKVWPTRAGLVPFTLHVNDKEQFSPLSGTSVDCIVSNSKISFRENILFTHRGLSGPAILQISSYWKPGERIHINLLPEIDLLAELKQAQKSTPKLQVVHYLSKILPKSLVKQMLYSEEAEKCLADCNFACLNRIAEQFQHWQLMPNNTEGYRTAEVTLGGVDCNALSSKTMEARDISGLYFIGEAIDVTGWLGGYNFQWAWSSAVAAARHC
jgi:predicted Rossmann fold flavoprotein